MDIVANEIVSSVVERIGDWLVAEAKLLSRVRSKVTTIQAELNRMKWFLKDADAKNKEGELDRNFVLEIEDIAYDAEDAIETFVLKVAFKSREGNIHYFFKRYACIFTECIDRHKVDSDIEDVKTRISELFKSLQNYHIRSIAEGEGSSSSAHRQRLLRRSYPHIIEEDFISLDDDVKKLVGHMVNEDRDSKNYYQTVCMGGLGKTTLAQKVYNHKDVQRHFDVLAWTCISQQLQKQDVLQGILVKLIPEKKDEIRHMKDEELVELLYQVQSDKKCLIVVDDIWKVEDWDILKSAFPIGKTSSSRSKILLTTRNEQVARRVDLDGFLHEPRFLAHDEAWELLQKKAFGRARGSSGIRHEKKMEELGSEMVKHCGGLPLAVVVLGGILRTRDRVEEWEKVHHNINSYINKGTGVGQQHSEVSQVLALSYDNLPYQLKRCFLYLGSFPEDSSIKLDKLYQLLVAEGLVMSSDKAGEETMTDVAERYLNELAHRYMVKLQVDEPFSERYKYCSLHDMMREVCLSRSKEENFFHVIDFGHEKGESSGSSSSNCKVRRLAVYLSEENCDEDEWVSSFEEHVKTYQHHLRSVLFFGDSIKFPPRIMKEFKVLRVLHLDCLRNVEELPKAIGKLIHLRYLSLRCYLAGGLKLPSSIGNLRCLQTLDLQGNEESIIPNVLWKIESLTHLYLDDSLGDDTNRKTMMRLDGLSKLEMLKNFDSRWCDVKDLSKLTSLRKLWRASIHGVGALINYLSIMQNHSRLRLSSIWMHHQFESEEDLIPLRQLLECRHLNKLWLEGIIGSGKLPAAHHFSPSLTTLILKGSKLKEEDPMATLEKLPNLIGLSLWDAFDGVEMVCSKEGFPQLKFLRLSNLSNLEEWRVDEGAMPNLSELLIKGCRRLKMVPDGLRFLNTLQELTIWEMPEAFERGLKVVDGEEGADHYKIKHVPGIQFPLCWIYWDGPNKLRRS